MLTPPTYPGDNVLRALPIDPLRVITSACLVGAPVVTDGSHLRHSIVVELMALPNVELISFCPENFSFGTPRDTPNCVAGNGFDVLDGKARFESHGGEDWTDGIVRAAGEMARQAVGHKAHLAIMLHVSGACGPQVIYDGHRDNKHYQHGPGVAAAAIMRAGIPVISQIDWRALRIVMQRVKPDWQPPTEMPEQNWWEDEWYQGYFGSP